MVHTGAKIEVPSVEKPRTMRVLGDSLHSSPCLFQYFMPFSVFHAFFFYLPIPVQMWVFPNTDRSEWIRCSFIHDLRFTGDWTLNTKKQSDCILSFPIDVLILLPRSSTPLSSFVRFQQVSEETPRKGGGWFGHSESFRTASIKIIAHIRITKSSARTGCFYI